MRALLLLLSFVCCTSVLYGQIFDPKVKAKRAAENRVNNRIDQGIDKGLNKVEEGIGNIFKKKSKNSNNDEGTSKQSSSGNKGSNGGGSSSSGNDDFSVSGKFDFVPGEKVIVVEDFSQDALGDFPAKWNTNGSGELVRLGDQSSKFLKTSSEVVFYPEFVKKLPENFTVEFDLVASPNFSFYNGFFIVGFTSEPNVGANWRLFKRFGNRAEPKANVEVAFHPTSAGGQKGRTVFHSFGGGKEIIKNDAEQSVFKSMGRDLFAHVSIWRQKGRVRVYLNDVKIWDIPRALNDGAVINSIYFRNDGSGKDDQAFFISNLRVAVGAPDTRNKLITEGKFVTTGILFDVNSDKIKPESYGVLKEIANVLQENESVKVKIVGHTDSDGDDASNLALSKRRAESVKRTLVSKFGISESRMVTDGKGQSEPVSPNNTPEGKANNRRVEFIKM